MPKKDPKIDAYISKSAPFARPILSHLRKLVHSSCPEVKETFKWSCPHFMYRGKMLCGMAAFKTHCKLGFWQGLLIMGDDRARAKSGMDRLEKITSLKELPPSAKIHAVIKKAMKVSQTPRSAKKTIRKRPPAVPSREFRKALQADKKTCLVFKEFSPTHQREYIEWIDQAKTDETRDRRIETAVDWISEKKTLHWKYQ